MTMNLFAKLMVTALIGSLGGVWLFAQMPPIGCVQPAACSDSNCPGDDCMSIEIRCSFGGTPVGGMVSKSCCITAGSGNRPWRCCETTNYWYTCNNGGGMTCNTTESFVRLNCKRNETWDFCPQSSSGCVAPPDPEE